MRNSTLLAVMAMALASVPAPLIAADVVTTETKPKPPREPLRYVQQPMLAQSISGRKQNRAQRRAGWKK